MTTAKDIINKEIPLLDHGFLRVVDVMGDDRAVVDAARVSYGTGTKKVNEDRGLIRYLLKHKHTSPFEMCEIKLHIKMPIFVARQWIRHRTANVNEYSGRYSVLDKEFYIPSPEVLQAQSKDNKQGRGGDLSEAEITAVLNTLKKDATSCYSSYQLFLNDYGDGTIINEDKQGIARELARMTLNLNYYTQMYWKIDLHNLMHFINLRSHPHAQYEIRVYADAMLEILREWVPITCQAFIDYTKEAHTFSRLEVIALKKLLKGEPVNPDDYGISQREWKEFTGLLEINP